MINEMTSFIEHARGAKCLMDIGALYGVFSTVFLSLNPGACAYAFEPHPESFRILSANGALTRGMVPVNKAVSDSAGTLMMHEEWGIHYAAGAGIFREDKPDNFGVECITGDSLCIAPDFVKIDVEGHEMSVLEGLHQTLKQHHPKILLEIHSASLIKNGTSSKKVCEFLKNLGYTPICTQQKTPISFEEVEASENDARVIFV